MILADRGMKITEFADNTGLSRTTLTQLTKNTGKGIQFDTMEKICELLEITPGELFSYYPFEITFESIRQLDNNESKGYFIFGCKFKVKSDTFYGEILCDLKGYGTKDFDKENARLVIVIWHKLLNKLSIVPNKYIAEYFVNYYRDEILKDHDAVIKPEFGMYDNKDEMWLKINLNENN